MIMSNEFKDWLADFTDEQRKNYDLCMKYPILIPRSYWATEVEDDYMYEYTHLDQMPTGWRNAFGEQWAADVQSVVNKMSPQEQERFVIVGVKEKFGYLNVYVNYYTEELVDVFKKYEQLSARTCVKCGAPATKITRGWIDPFCNMCVDKLRCPTVSIEEWFTDGNN